MPDNLTAYVNYFRQLAVQHKDLLHDPLTEQGKGDIKRASFATFGNNEIISGLRTNIGPTVLGLELYDNNLSSETAYDIRQSPKGAFMVINHAIENNYPDEERAYAFTEGILFEILKRIWQDHYGPLADSCTRPFKQFRWNGSITPTGKLFTNYYGYYVEFEFDFQNTIDITQPPAPGTFINT